MFGFATTNQRNQWLFTLRNDRRYAIAKIENNFEFRVCLVEEWKCKEKKDKWKIVWEKKESEKWEDCFGCLV